MATLHLVSSLRGYAVRSRAGEVMGAIEDFILDLEGDRVSYAVVSFGGFLGVGEHHFAVPFTRLDLDTENECFVADVDEAELKGAGDPGGELPADARRAVYRFRDSDALRQSVP